MPDSLTVIPTDLAAKPMRPRKAAAPSSSQPFLDADQMRALWFAALEVEKNWDSKNEKKCGALFDAAVKRIADARTLDPIGIGYKLLATRQWPTNRREGLAEDLKDSDHEHRSIARVIQDAGVLDHLAGDLPARRISSRLRPLLRAYQAAWKEVSDAGDAEDDAMLARPKDAPRMSTQAEKDAESRMELARTAYQAASDALTVAPTRTFDDALCRIEHAIDLADESTNADLISSLNKALRILRKANVEA